MDKSVSNISLRSHFVLSNLPFLAALAVRRSVVDGGNLIDCFIYSPSDFRIYLQVF